MSLEDDTVQAAQVLVAGSKQEFRFLATITSETPLEAKVDGSSVALPCIRTDGTEMTIGKQVVLLMVGPKYYVIGALGTYTAPPEPEATVFGVALLSDTAIPSSSLSVIAGLTLAVPSAGTYVLRAMAAWLSSGSINVNVQFDYTGTITDVGKMAYHKVSTGGGVLADQGIPTLGTAIGAAATQEVQTWFSGSFVVSTAGDFTVSFSRASGTSTVQEGSNYVLTKVA